MSISEAFEQLISTQSFKDIAKIKNPKGGHYRLLKSRHNRGLLKYGAMVDILLEFEYKVIVENK